MSGIWAWTTAVIRMSTRMRRVIVDVGVGGKKISLFFRLLYL